MKQQISVPFLLRFLAWNPMSIQFSEMSEKFSPKKSEVYLTYYPKTFVLLAIPKDHG